MTTSSQRVGASSQRVGASFQSMGASSQRVGASFQIVGASFHELGRKLPNAGRTLPKGGRPLPHTFIGSRPRTKGWRRRQVLAVRVHHHQRLGDGQREREHRRPLRAIRSFPDRVRHGRLTGPPRISSASSRGKRRATTVAGPGGEVPSVFRPSSPEAQAIADLFGDHAGHLRGHLRRRRGARRVLRRPLPPPRGGRRAREQIARAHAAGDRLDDRARRSSSSASSCSRRGRWRASDPPVDREPGHRGHRPPVVVGGAVPRRASITANEIHIPVGQAARSCGIESADVIHDFWVAGAGAQDRRDARAPEPHLAGGRRAGHLPRAPARSTAARSTRGCASVVVAETPAEFAAWERHERRARAGLRWTRRRAPRRGGLPRSMTCVQLPRHRAARAREAARRARPHAPRLAHDPRRRRPRRTPRRTSRAGSRIPQAIKPGCHMPDLQLTDAQVNDLVAYFETLR